MAATAPPHSTTRRSEAVVHSRGAVGGALGREPWSPADVRILRRLVAGAPPSLPPSVDRAVEGWWRLPPRLRAAATVVLAVALVAVAGAGAARDPWGPPVEVAVATRDLPPGTALAPDDLRIVTRPADAVPPGAVPPGDEATGQLRLGLPSGAVLTAAHLGPGATTDALGAGQVAVAVPLELLPSLTPGQRLDVLSGDPQGVAARLAADATVLAVDDTHAWLMVARDDAPAVAAAAAWGALGVARLPDR